MNGAVVTGLTLLAILAGFAGLAQEISDYRPCPDRDCRMVSGHPGPHR